MSQATHADVVQATRELLVRTAEHAVTAADVTAHAALLAAYNSMDGRLDPPSVEPAKKGKRR